MTINRYKEALTNLEGIQMSDEYSLGDIDEMDTLDYDMNPKRFSPIKAFECLGELVNKEEKYRWHDRRKDPNDLPTEPGRKYIITQCGNEKYIVAEWGGMYFGDWSTLFSEDNMIFTPYALVDKWKEIERFDNE